MGKKTSKSKSKPWKPLQPGIISAVNTTNDIVGHNQGNLESMAGDLRGRLGGLADMAFGEQPGLAAASGYLGDVLGGKYLGQGNPYMQGMINATAEDVGNHVNSTFGRAGRTGGGYHVESLSEGLGNAENGLRYADYNNERGQMMQAAGLLPSVNASRYAGIAPALAAYQTAGQLPYAGVGALGSIIGLASGTGTQTQRQPWGPQLLDAAATAAMAASDPRLKTDIEKVGELADGLGVYRWTYKDGFNLPEGRHEGVMADEVKALRPWAYIANFIGEYAGVNYALLGGE